MQPVRVFEPQPPAATVVTDAELQAHAIVGAAEDLPLLRLYLAAAVEMVERHTQRLLGARSCRLRLCGFPQGAAALELPGGRVSAVTAIRIDSVPATIPLAIAGESPARLVPVDPWPAVTGSGLAVEIDYVAGYAEVTAGDYGSGVPAALKVAAMQIAAEMFEQRQAGSPDRAEHVPFGARLLMRTWRILPIPALAWSS